MQQPTSVDQPFSLMPAREPREQIGGYPQDRMALVCEKLKRAIEAKNSEKVARYIAEIQSL